MTLYKCFGKWIWIAALISTALLPVCHSQAAVLTKGVLTNRDVVTLANAGFSEEFILEMITTSSTRFDLTADAMADLAKNGITEDIIRAMRNPGQRPPSLDARHQTRSASAPRVFVETSSQSHAQAAAVTKAFGQSCPGYLLTNRQEEAAFAVVLEREPAKWFRRENKITVFDQSGDTIFDTSTHDLRGAVRDFCQAARIAKGVSVAH